MTLRLHDYLPSGNGYKVGLLLTQLGIPFERIEYDIDRGETRTPAFLENVNANGRVPALETEEGESLPESNAILFYLSGPRSSRTIVSEGRVRCSGCSLSSTVKSRRTPALNFRAPLTEGDGRLRLVRS